MARIGALVHFYVNWRSAGSETVLHNILRHLVEQGHEVTAYVTAAPRSAEEMSYEGVRLVPVRSAMHGISKLRTWQPQVTFTHHENAVTTLQMRQRIRSRVFFLTHNDMSITEMPLKMKPDFVVWNSEWVRASLTDRLPVAGRLQGMVMHPPLAWQDHVVGSPDAILSRGAITLVNHNAHKGAHVLFGLAEMMPERRFIAVRGGHGEQVPIPRHLTNIEQWAQNPDMRPVWSNTRLVLMPSVYESYGLVSVEAGVSGIPVLAHPTPGLQEALGGAGFWCDRDDLQAYADTIEWLDEDAMYRHASGMARANSEMKAAESTRALEELTRHVERFALPGMRVN
jgi:hypothetical protein